MSTSKPKAPAKSNTPDDLLDEALAETFPASDPIAVHPDETEQTRLAESADKAKKKKH